MQDAEVHTGFLISSKKLLNDNKSEETTFLFLCYNIYLIWFFK